MAWDQATMKITPPTYARVTVVKLAMEQEKKRQVTYSEVIDYLVTHWETMDQLTAGIREAGR
jgi:hypothetical protein